MQGQKLILTQKICKFILTLMIIYSLTGYAANINQKTPENVFFNHKYVFFTNITAFTSVITIFSGYLISYLKRKDKNEDNVSKVYYYLYKFETFILNGLYKIYTPTLKQKQSFLEKLELFYNTLLPVILSLEVIVTSFFWYSYFFNQSLIYSPFIQKPENRTYLFTEIGLHLCPFLILLLEQINWRVVKTDSQVGLLVAFLSVYGIFLKLVSYFFEKYPYPFIKRLPSDYFRIFGLGVFICVALLIYKSYMHIKINGLKINYRILGFVLFVIIFTGMTTYFLVSKNYLKIPALLKIGQKSN
jgi:hypothetical protein